jgi:transposase
MEPTYDELRRENEGLKRENDRLKRENERLERQVVELQAQVERLRKLLEDSQRQAKRQAAPFRKLEGPVSEPQSPGRKRGRQDGRHAHRAIPSPEEIDERYEAPLPGCCPHCGGRRLRETQTTKQYQTEIPRRPIHREFTIHVGECQDCGRRVQGGHPLQTSEAVGAAASQLGPDAQAAFVLLNKKLGLSHGKCPRLFRDLFGIRIARATSVRSLGRTAQRAAPACQELQRVVRGSAWVVPDETGWRVGGRSAWRHVFVTPTATCYAIGDRSGGAGNSCKPRRAGPRACPDRSWL